MHKALRLHPRPDRQTGLSLLAGRPLLIALAAAIVIGRIDIYAQVFRTVVNGVGVTVFVTLVAFVLARARVLPRSDLCPIPMCLRRSARFYMEIFRGIPFLVLLF